MYIFCSKALADALNIKKNELQKMPADAQMDDLYAWHGHITKLNGNMISNLLPERIISTCMRNTFVSRLVKRSLARSDILM